MKTKPLLAALALAAATSAAADAPDLTGSMEFLCNPNKSRWPSTSADDARSRSMTAIVPYRGKFYVSGGCWDPNTGAAPIFAVDPDTGAFVPEYNAGTERFDYFREASTGHLYAPVTDQHEDGPNWGALFRRDPDGTWRCFKDIIPRGDFPAGTFGNIDNQGFAIHTWDLCCWKGNVFTAGYGIAYGPEGSDGTMANATPGLGTAYRQFKASDSSYTSYYRRFYAFLPFEDDLFCTTLNYSPASAPEINAFEEWRFDAAAGVFRCEERPWSEFAPGVTAQDRAAVSGTYVAPANTTPFKGRVLYLLGPSSVDSPKPWCLFSAANVDHHVKATKVDLGGATPFCICRHVTRHGDEVVDVLAAQFDPSDRTVVNSVWESSDGVSFEKLFTFRTAQQASALARAGDCFYAGIGWRFTTTWNLACRDGSSGNAGDDASGDIYRIPFRPVYRPLDLARAVGTPKEKGAKARVAVTVSCLEAPSASLSLAVDGATVASWPSVAEGETCSAVVPTEPGSSHSFVFTGRPEGYDPVTAEGSFVATPDDGWFRVDLDDPGYEAGTGWTDTGYVPNPDGAWTVSGFSSLSADPAAPTRRVEVDGPGAAVFAAERASAASADAVVTGIVCVAAYDAPPDLSAVAPAASLSFVRASGGAIAPYGYDGAAWHRLDPPAAGLAAGRWTRYAAEFDLSSAEAPRVRFRLDGELLLAAGSAWLPLAAAPQGLSEVVFTGSGSFGSFAGEERPLGGPRPALGEAKAAVAEDGLSATLSVPVLSVGEGGLTLALSLDGAVVKTWTGVGAPGVFSHAVETVPGSSHSFAFSAADAAGATASAAGVFAATALDGWFDVRFSDPGYEAGTNWWSDLSRVSGPGGSWTAADAASALVGVAGSAPRHVELNATEGVAYVATAPSRDGADVAVRGRVRVCAEGAPPAAPAAGDLGGLAFVGGEGGAIVPWGFAAGGGWFAFDAPAAPLEHGAWYDWEVDLDLSSDAAPAIRYRLGGAALLRAGAEWLPLPGGVAHATGVVFRGDGAIGDFKGVYAGGRIVGEPVVPAFGGGSPLAFGADPATGGATFSMTVVNAVAGCYYTVFAATALGDDFVAEKDGEPAPADGTLVLTAAAGTPARFFRIVVSTFPVEAGTLFSSLPLSP